MNNKQLLVSLQGGASLQQDPKDSVTVNQPQNTTNSCATKPTDSITIDSNSFGDDDCADIEFAIVNNSGEDQVIRLGKPGQAGVYQKLGLVADASNVAGVTADAGDGPEPNVLPLQGFNFLTQDGIVVTALEIEIVAGGNLQGAQKVKLQRQSVNVTDKCRTTKVKPTCSECFNDTDPLTYLFKFCRMWDAYNHADYTILEGSSVTLRVYYAGLATAKGIVACAGTNKGQVVHSIVQS